MQTICSKPAAALLSCCRCLISPDVRSDLKKVLRPHCGMPVHCSLGANYLTLPINKPKNVHHDNHYGELLRSPVVLYLFGVD